MIGIVLIPLGNVCPYIGKFAQGTLYTISGDINSPSKNIKTGNIFDFLDLSTSADKEFTGISFKMNKDSQLGYYIGGLAGSNLGSINNSIVDINLNFGYNDRFVRYFWWNSSVKVYPAL